VRELSLMRWGLIPSWAEDSSAAASMINARAETASTKPAFRYALKSRRCLIPADGFHEWMRTGKGKQPYCFEVNDGELFAFAGLWERWRDASGNTLETCSILTTTPNAVTSAIHDRMPVILDSYVFDLWLDPGMRDVGAVSELLKPIRRSAHAVFSHKHSDQSRGERRRGMFTPCGDRRGSESAFRLARRDFQVW
jgi:putative SOS response-associated peptidase YedK